MTAETNASPPKIRSAPSTADAVLAVDAVLQADANPALRVQRSDGARGRFGVEQLDAEQDDVHHSQLAGLVTGMNVLNDGDAIRTAQRYSQRLDRLEVIAARDARHIVAGLREPGAVISAYSPGVRAED